MLLAATANPSETDIDKILQLTCKSGATYTPGPSGPQYLVAPACDSDNLYFEAYPDVLTYPGFAVVATEYDSSTAGGIGM